MTGRFHPILAAFVNENGLGGRDSFWTQAASPEKMMVISKVHQKHKEPTSQDPEARVSCANCFEGMRQYKDSRTPINMETTALPAVVSHTKVVKMVFYNKVSKLLVTTQTSHFLCFCFVTVKQKFGTFSFRLF